MPNPDMEHLITLVGSQTGYKVSVGTTDETNNDAEMISASPSNPVHIINVSARCLSAADYIVSAQCVMLLAMWSHPNGIPQMNALPDKLDYAIQKASRWRGLARYPSDAAQSTARFLVNGLLHQLMSTPSELIAMEHCFKECPSLRQQQTDAINGCLRRYTQGMTPEVRGMTPPDIFEKNQSLCACLARLWCDLTGGEVAMLPYKTIGVDSIADKLLGHWRCAPSGTWGERLVWTVDKWADELRIRTLYTWTFRDK